MKVLVIYYSNTGNTKKAADYIAKKLGADTEQIKDAVPRKGLLGFVKSGYQAANSKPAKIDAIKSKVEDYDVVIIGTPVWAHHISSPVNSFLLGFGGKIKNYAILMTRSNKKDDCACLTEIFESKIKKPALAFVSLCSANPSNTSALDDFVTTIKELDNKG